MKTLTYAEIEKLQYILNKYMFDTCTVHSKENISLKNKLIVMRSQLECTKYYKDLTPQEIIDSL